MQITLGKKLFLYTSGILVVLLLVTFLVLERSQSRQWEEHLRSQSVSFVRFATPELLKLFRGSFSPQADGSTVQEVNDFLAVNADLIQVTIYSPNGRLLYRSPGFGSFSTRDLTGMEEEIAPERMQSDQTTTRTLSLSGGGRILDLVTPAFSPSGARILAVRYLISYDSVDIRLAEVRQHFIRIAVLAVLCSLVLVALAARRVTRPIQELTVGARSIARGDLQTRIATPRGDEIGALALAFNEMAESLAVSQHQLTEKNRALSGANSELRTMQEQLIRAERLAAIGQLAAGVSHEIDNPVGIILGYAELLREDLTEGDPRREDVQAIIDECKRCKRITGGLLGFARTAPPCTEPLQLAPLVEGTLTSLQPQKLFRQIVVRLEKGPALPPIVGDADQLRQVLVNLFLNAAQAMEGKGTLTVKIRREGEEGVVLVSDSGPGVPAELLERIFEPFFSTKGSGEGTGLGLSLCRKLAEAHGGTLRAEESDSGGALFRLGLPLATKENCFDKGPVDSLG
jgi:signal transduction histidine kinase